MVVAVRREVEEISAQPDRALACAALLHLQRRCADDPTAMAALSASSPDLLPRLLSDAHRPDEEIAAQAVKCLGFMLYHPTLVATISDFVARNAGLAVESLANLILTTRMKAVCNLGVWCVSIQQLRSGFVESLMDLVLRAVVHALDNPFGSLSTTFEAMQALAKLSTQLCEKMREMSDIWVPPLYRRLISFNKRERDMSGRCLLKTKSTIHPPPLNLSKAIASDLKRNLLLRMMDMLQSHEQKVHIIHAWGWYIYFLGSHALSKRHLVNEMLKIPEQTFRDADPQIQIASLIAWESLVDAFLPPHIIDLEKNIVQVHGIQKNGSASSMPLIRNCKNQVDGLLKRVKVIMLPLRGIVSSRCDVSVRCTCLNTWQYLLHKLDLLVNHPAVLEVTFESILEVVFSNGLDRQSISLWSLCLYLFDEFILAKVKIKETGSTSAKNSCYIEDNPTSPGSSVNYRGLWMDYPIKWLPWEICSLNFHLKMIGNIVSQRSMKTVDTESRILALNAALRIFRSVLQGIQAEWSAGSTPYNSTMFCINMILKFTKDVCEEMVAEQNANPCCNISWTALRFVEAIRDELEPTILESPLYLVSLDLKYINKLQCSDDSGCPKLGGLGMRNLTSMDMVSPMVYATILHLSVVAESDLSLSERDDILCMTQNSKFIFFMCNSSISLQTLICFLYMHIRKPVNGRLCWLAIWSDIAKGLKENIDHVHNISFLKTECDDISYTILYWFLCYPFLFFFPKNEVVAPSSSQKEPELEPVMEVWRSLFDPLNHVSQTGCSVNNFVEGLSKSLIKVLYENSDLLERNVEFCLKEKAQNVIVLLTLGEVVIHILNQNQVLDLSPTGSTLTCKEDSNHKLCSPIKNSLDLAARFFGLLLAVVKANPQTEHEVISRFFVAMASFVRRLYLKQDIVLLMEVISVPLIQWLSSCTPMYREMQQGNTICQLRYLWEEVLDCLRRSQPSIGFDSQFLDYQGALLETAFDHPDSSISCATIAFWRATYDHKANLDYPPCLLPVLHKLSRSGKINIPRENPIIFKNNDFLVQEAVGMSKRHTTPIMKKRASGEETENSEGFINALNMGLRRKRLKVTNKPVDVKGAPEKGFKNFHANTHSSTAASFSTLFRCSPGKQELRKPEYILEMLRRGK